MKLVFYVCVASSMAITATASNTGTSAQFVNHGNTNGRIRRLTSAVGEVGFRDDIENSDQNSNSRK